MIPITKPLLGEAEGDAARAVVLSTWLAQGLQVEAFEFEFAAWVGAVHACAVTNCTSALALALRAVEVGPGDEVVTVSHSFIAAANCISLGGGKPVFIDVLPDTYNLDPAGLDAAITPRTRAVLCVHQIGMPCDLSQILAIAKARGLAVIEDAACAAGSEIFLDGRWQRIGKPHADIACFSFHPRKVITTGEGGILTTANPEYDRLFRLWRQHGMDVASNARHAAENVIFETYPVEGFNYRMTDIQAAIGRKQIERLTTIVERRRNLPLDIEHFLQIHEGSACHMSQHGRGQIGKAIAYDCLIICTSARRCRHCATAALLPLEVLCAFIVRGLMQGSRTPRCRNLNWRRSGAY